MSAPVGQNGGSAVGAGHGGSFEAAAGPGFGSASGGSGGFGPPSGGFGTGPGPAAPHGQAPATAPGWAGAGTLPPPPSAPPGGPGGPGGQGEARPLQAVAVGLLNLSCLGLGYVLLRHWIGAAVCWAATAALLLLALPADANGVPAGVLVGYGAVLLAAAADGARRGLRARLSLGTTARHLALPLAVVLLAAPAGATVAYGAAREEAREEAFQQSLLARLGTADALVKAKEGVRFAVAERDYRTALDTYERLALDHPGSRAAKLVPERMDAYFASVSTPYTQKKYCEAVDPLAHLRSLPDSVDEGVLGNRADGLDDSLARSLYECGAAEFRRGALQSSYASFTELASLFPKSEHIGEVERLVGDGLRKAAAPLGDGSAPDPCATTEQVRKQRDDAAGLKGYALGGPVADAGRAVQKGAFSCGAKQFRDGQYSEAVTSMDRYAKDYPDSPQAAHARTISIAAQIADHEPAAGKKLPPATAPGGSRMPMVVSNDGKESVELLYTGPVTGKITLEACGTCENYGQFRDVIDPDAKPCGGPSSKYPKATLRLPEGTYHFLQRRAGGGFAVAGETKTSKASIEPGYTYTNCLYVTTGR
ncbi:tetratricopeptide repeat protein [Streptomyces roseolus]|uniref:tetratricopeptide repeat protein n=1 Tax=Streptomyces roseolus TaxID=67358 RepID=UPI0033E5BA9E